MSIAQPHELLNALLDGELSDEEERAVRQWLQHDAGGARELEALTEVRAMVRGLPDVDPPVDFYQRLLLAAERESFDAEPAPPQPDPVDDRHEPSRSAPITMGSEPSNVSPISAAPSRRRRSLTGASVAAAAAVAAALVLVLGITPATDRIVPPVQAFAERHDSMMARPATAPFSGSEYQAVPTAELDGLHAPFMAPATFGRFARQSGYRHGDVVHVVYSDGGMTFSVYEQRGALDWSRLSATGQRHTLGATNAWETQMGSEEVMVLELDGMVVTVVADAPADQMMSVAKSVPSPPATSLMDRVGQNCSDLVRAFTGGG